MSRSRKISVLVVVFACSVLLAIVVATNVRAGNPGVEGGGIVVDSKTDSPLVNGKAFSNLASARQEVVFSPIAPDAFGGPKAFVVSDPASTSETDRSFAAVYDDKEYGRFWIVENSTTSTPASIKGMVSGCTVDAGCETKMDLVTLVDGSTAAVMRQNTQGVMWVANGVLYDVVGPVETLSWDESVAIASEVAKLAAAS